MKLHQSGVRLELRCSILLLLSLWAGVVALSAAKNPDLIGRVVAPGGDAVANAWVFIYTAGPRLGPGYI